MKQHITAKQLDELSEDQKERLRAWWVPKYGDMVFVRGEEMALGKLVFLADHRDMGTEGNYYDHGCGCCAQEYKPEELQLLPSIGQMIELLSDNSSIANFFRYDDVNGEKWNVRGTFYRKNDRFFEPIKEELCDALWEAVKAVL